MMAPSLAARSAAIFVKNEVVQLGGLSSRQRRVLARSPTDTRSWFSRAATSEAAASVPVDYVAIAVSVLGASIRGVVSLSLATPLPVLGKQNYG